MKVIKSSLFIIALMSLTVVGCHQKSKSTSSSGIEKFDRPNASSYQVEGISVPYVLGYDPDVWMIVDTPFHSRSEESTWDWMFMMITPSERKSLGPETPSEGSVAFIFSDTEKNRTSAQIKERVQNDFLKGLHLEDFQDMGSEERVVNGVKVFAWKFKVTTTQKLKESNTWIFDNYYASGEFGSVSVVTMTLPDLWDKNEEDIEDLLNGLSINTEKKIQSSSSSFTVSS